MEIEPKPVIVRAGQVIARSHQRLIVANDSMEDDAYIGMPELFTDGEDQERLDEVQEF
jgi:hypothetical protein